MNRQCDAAVATAELVPAFAAQQVRRVAASIDENDRLLAGGECLAQFVAQRRAEDDEAFVFLLGMLAPQVKNFYFG